ncbi:MAG: 5-methylthioadenosine/S-adenosylhomocysteine deaminase [Caballeronia sp.]|jgi:5-methylthioadenosine/S-adenosylhomocysteine deaminase|nr:5-methylthioadenosine/S-adenosylhomocysteine deaminase [Caballeronia sp.]
MHPVTYDLLITGATVLTADPAQPVLRDAAVAISGNRLAFVGRAADLPAGTMAHETRRLDGRVIAPGYVNVHTHAILSMVRGVAEDLGFAPAYTPGIPHGHDVRPDEAIALARLGAMEAMLFGSTLINDSYVHADLTLGAMAELGLRVYACGRLHDVDFSGVADGRWEHHTSIGERTLDDALRLADRWHGTPDGRTGVQLAVHAPDTCSDAFLELIARAAHERDLGVTTHLAQSRTEVAQVLRRSGKTPAQLLDSVGLLDSRLVAAHCLFLDPADIARVGRAGITVAHIPKGNATGGTMAPTPALRAAGARIALGTDNMHADMTEVMRWALAIARIQLGEVASDWQPADALAMATCNGAAAMGLGDRLGCLVEGWLADLVVFDFRRAHLTPHPNPLGTLVHTGMGRDVEMVIVDGRIVVDDGLPTLCDAQQVIEAGNRAAQQLWARATA